MPTSTAVEIAFVNNMPDAAFVETERQFRVLLGVGLTSPAPARLRLYAPPERLTGAEPDVASRRARYRPVEELFATRPAGVVVTGCEPAGGELRDEPLWPVFERVFEWAPGATGSLWLACLAAHAALAHYDGLRRRPLRSKYSALLSQAVDPEHPLTAGLPARVALPHSRSNEVPTAEVSAAGYRLAIASEETGWTVATTERGGCLLVAVQGHPEYGADTLLREYRRDVRRYLAGERDTYPPLPQGYLDGAAEERFAAFRGRAEAQQRAGQERAGQERAGQERAWRRGPGERPVAGGGSSGRSGEAELLGQFPFAEEAGRLRATWAPIAARLGRNWLAIVAARSSAARTPVPTRS